LAGLPVATGVHGDTIMRLSVRVGMGAARLHDRNVFVALASTAKAIISYRVRKRDGANTRAFVADLRERVLGHRPD